MRTRTVQGRSVSPGLVIGPVHVVHAGPQDVPTWTVSRDDVPLEIGRLAEAVNVASERLEERRRHVAATAGQKDAEIFAVQRMILQDPAALHEVEAAIAEQRINAEAAVKLVIERLSKTMGGLAGNNVRSFASDVSDPWRHVLSVLLQRDREEILHSDERVVLAAVDLTPTVVTYLDRERVLGVVTEAGGRFSHGAVLARSCGVPCVVGLPNLLARLEQNMLIAVDGDRGRVTLRPEQHEIDAFLERRRALEGRREELLRDAAHPAQTPDGERLDVAVNIESVRDLDTFDLAQADGVGLLRTEFLYLERNEFPSEEEQYRLYRGVLERMGERPVTLRLLDIGGDKSLPYFHLPPETNPALGWRGLRITLQWRDLLRVQLRALLRASTSGSLRILIPMVSSLEQIREVHATFDEVRSELEAQGYDTVADVPVGAMIEVPSLVLLVDGVMREVDFVSVGTNDLVQYLLAVDRDNSWVGELYDPRHPAVLRALAEIARAAREGGKPASVCGDLASEPAMAVLLQGMGYHGVSLAPHFLPEVKYAIRRTEGSAAREWVREALAADSSAGVSRVIEQIRATLYDQVRA